MSSAQKIIPEPELVEKHQLDIIVGAENVIDDPNVLEKYSHDMSFMPVRSPSFVVKPKQADQIQEITKWANRTLMPLIPISSGPPHFRGDTVPEQGGVVVDLSNMKKIMRVDRRNRVAMIEPGVTFLDLQPEVEKQGMRIMIPLAPRATKSIIGSYLEREPILVPKYHWDISDPLCCTEVVFGTGDFFRTGAAAGPGTLDEQRESGQAQKNPLGPGPSDFFRVVQGAQGTLGIVTWATIRLELLPSMQEIFMVGCKRVDQIIEFVYKLQRLKLGDECLVLDRLNLSTMLEREPKGIEELRSILPDYILIFVVAGYDRFPEERLAYQTKDIMEIAQRYGLNPAKTLPGVNSRKLLQVLSKPCPEPFWKLRHKGNSADIFFFTTLDRSPEYISMMHEKACETRFPLADIGMYIQPIQQGRSCHMEFNLTFNPESEFEVTQVRRTFEQACEALMLKGAFFSRPYGIWAKLIHNQSAENVLALRKVKQIFDPNNVMNPGKLFF